VAIDFAEIKAKLCSVVAIPVTPFVTSGDLDRQAYTANIRRLVAAGLTVITPNGNTGEFYSLSPIEQEAAAELASEGAEGRALIVAGAGYDVSSVVKVGRWAQKHGAAVMVHQPVHPYLSPEGWVRYHEQIAEQLLDVAIVLYVRSQTVTGEHLAKLANSCPNVVAVKYAVPDPLRFAAVMGVVTPGRLAWLCGLAEMWTPFFWMAGARGFTSGLANFRPDLSLKLLHCLEAEDYGAAYQVAALVRPFEAMRARDNGALNVSVVKEAMAQLGLSSRDVRPPIVELDMDQRNEVAALIRALDSTK